MKSLVSYALLALFSAVSLLAGPGNGEQAPAFTLKTADGTEVSLSDFEGDYVVLEWVNPNCPFVAKFYNAGAMQRFQKEARQLDAEADVVWLSINSTNPKQGDYLSPEETLEFIEEKEVESTWLLDPTGEVGRSYGATNTPHMFVINPEGNVVYQGAIDSIRTADPADIERADNYVMTALKAAIAGEEIDRPVTRPYGCTMKY